ncbi:MAG TPA: hypothetical protein VG013_07455 [Gemmataceae bacterium]|jgi:hypothetical protein|nr:hypothetical protein [Gemmataceae bacterium]
MKERFPRRWVGIGVLGPALVLGCRHAPRQCDCGSRLEPTPVVLSSDYRPKPPEQTDQMPYSVLPAAAVSSGDTPDTHAAATTVTESVLPAAAKMVEPPAGTVLVTAVAPDSPGAASTTGTIELTAAEAAAMGIRPGYTPGALIVPARPHDPVVWPALATKTDADASRLVPSPAEGR